MNRLANETSPYLLQHSHNPVDWYPWGEEALRAARERDKPILVSIGYAACHWCHVMERESFENTDTARFMNENFINIKIDREERPDLDHIYMDAVQAMTGSGGWPLNVFLTPDAKPFYGGTYFPPRQVYNRASWPDVLAGVDRAFRERRDDIEQQADHLVRHVSSATVDSLGIGEGVGIASADPIFQPATLDKIRDQLLATADKKEGGFGGAPKFPQTFSIRWLLYDHYYTHDRRSLDQACLSLDKMLAGGIYDQLGGGFARYSTDEYWLAPHFEKMLYDQALLVMALCEAYQVTKKERYREAIGETIAFIDRELSNGQGGFYSALDADSEGIEGKYYVWDKAEIDMVLGEDAALFNRYYGVSESGNWEGKNILTHGPGEHIDSSVEGHRLREARLRLLGHRGLRVRPALDDKVLLGWNALMNVALSKAYEALGDETYRERAITNMRFLQSHFKGEGIHFYYHTWKESARFPAFLDDYAALIAALIRLQEITGDTEYLTEAAGVLRYVIANFGEPDGVFFYYTHRDQADLVMRKREIYDGATPSGNSLMASNLLYLSVVFNEPGWAERTVRMTTALNRVVTSYPGSFGGWATIFQALTYTIPEIVITGWQPENARKELLTHLIPYRVFQSAREENTQFPLLQDRPVGRETLIFLCKEYTCQLPVNEVATAIRHLENVYKFQV
jgi:uncharacterized protein YyaL (SSP411 family)